jgi:hypothetical protein
LEVLQHNELAFPRPGLSAADNRSRNRQLSMLEHEAEKTALAVHLYGGVAELAIRRLGRVDFTRTTAQRLDPDNPALSVLGGSLETLFVDGAAQLMEALARKLAR